MFYNVVIVCFYYVRYHGMYYYTGTMYGNIKSCFMCDLLFLP